MITINAGKANLFLKASKSITSPKSIIRFNETFIYVESIVPINNILRFRISDEKENDSAYEMDFSSFTTIIKTLLQNEPIEVSLSPNKLLIEFKSKNKIFRTGDFKIVTSPKKETTGKYKFLDITPELVSQIKTHIRNISYSNILTNLNGLFIVGTNIYSTNAFAILRTLIESPVYNEAFEDKDKNKPFSEGVFLPMQVCSMITDLASSNLNLMIDQNGQFIICQTELFDIAFPISTFEMAENIKPNIEFVISSIEDETLLIVNIPSLLMEIDTKLLSSMNPTEVKFLVAKNKMTIAFKATVSNMNTEFTSNMMVENPSNFDGNIILTTKELINCLNVAQLYADTKIKLDSDKTKICFEFGNENEANNAIFIIALNEE